MSGAIDYAGLFPPASLSMEDAAAEYARHRGAPDEWALGRFVVPTGKWSALEAQARAYIEPGSPWPVSLLASTREAAAIRTLMETDSVLRVEAIECRVDSISDVAGVADLVSLGVDVYVEPTSGVDVDQLAPRLAALGAFGKIRTGGVTAAAFPSNGQVLTFLRSCRAAGLRFKATAGLHHALRGEYRLTYAPESPVGTMFGFLNIAVAAALVWFYRDDESVFAVLGETSPDAFESTDAGIRWRRQRLTIAQLDEVRSEFFVGFGSCSFREPMTEIGLEAVPRA